MKLRLRRLLVRVYLFGLLVLLCVGALQFTVGRLYIGRMGHSSLRAHITWIVDKAIPIGSTPAQLHRQLAQLHQELALQITLFDAESRLLDNTASPPQPPLTKDEVERLRRTHALPVRKHMGVAVGRFSDGKLVGYALVSSHRPEPATGRVIMPMLLTLLLVGAASVPFARSLTKPLERLAATARRLGQGDLRVRAASRRQDEVGDLARAMNEMAERIAQLMRAEKELLANVSHELRTPLARIRVALELHSSEKRTVDYLPEIAEDLAELESMVDDILTAAKLDLAQESLGRGTTLLRLSATDPQRIVSRAVARFSEHHPEHALIVETKDPLPMLKADPAMLRRALDNLLENAHKYSNVDQPIRLRAQTVVLPGQTTVLEIDIADAGIGIDSVDLPHVFTPFFRSDRSRARKTGGVGLGLPLARRIVRAHGGDIVIRSEVGIGTSATVRIPI